jgi:hypothetical protein
VTVIVWSPVVVLDEGSHDERLRLVEVYDHSQPSSRIEIAAIEPLAARDRVILAEVRTIDRIENRRGVAEHLRPAAL